MASIKIARSSYKKKDNTYNIVFRVFHKQEQTHIATCFNVKKDQFSNGKIISHPDKQKMNFSLSREYTDLQEKLLKVKPNILSNWTISQLIDYLIDDNINTEGEETDFFEFARKMIELKFPDKSKSTATLYNSTLKRVKGYTTHNILPFREINFSWLDGFKSYCLSIGNSTNTVVMHLRNIRSIYNMAIDYDIVDYNSYPFRRFKIKIENTKHRALTLEQLQKIFIAETKTSLQQQSKDIFLLMFFLIGINMKDLYNMKVGEDGRISYYRAKTGKHYSIKLEPETMQILEKYIDKDNCFSLKNKYRNHLPITNRTNYNLKVITGLSDISAYWSRHTWATIASNIGVSKDDIALALGHGSNTVTDIYIKADVKRIDIANRMVIDYVMNSEVMVNNEKRTLAEFYNISF